MKAVELKPLEHSRSNGFDVVTCCFDKRVFKYLMFFQCYDATSHNL